jgi:hypothetical protein
MFTDDIPGDWVGKEAGCYVTRDSATGAHIGTLLKIGTESLVIEEDGHPTLYKHGLCVQGRVKNYGSGVIE